MPQAHLLFRHVRVGTKGNIITVILPPSSASMASLPLKRRAAAAKDLDLTAREAAELTMLALLAEPLAVLYMSNCCGAWPDLSRHATLQIFLLLL